jgi:hypothetical protein
MWFVCECGLHAGKTVLCAIVVWQWEFAPSLRFLGCNCFVGYSLQCFSGGVVLEDVRSNIGPAA